MERTRHHGRGTAYRRFEGPEDGPTLCCVHGSGGRSELWKAQTRLTDEATLVAVDLSGHGESEDVDASPGGETLAAYAADVIAAMEATDAGVLVGNSLGGAVGLNIALERAYDLDGLVLAGTGARLAVLEDLLVWLAEDFDRAIEFLHGPDRLFHDPPERLVSKSEETLRQTGRSVTERDFRTCHGFDVRNQLDRIDVPTLAVAGTHDRLTPVWYHEYLAEGIPDCTLAKVEESAHLAMLEQPSAFNAAVREFLERI